jgi:predicted nuclease of predicted toxin-antitoxin system
LKLLIDQNLPRQLTAMLGSGGHDVTHTEDEAMTTASDPVILRWCCEAQRTLLTADKKMIKYLVGSGVDCPSVLVTRELRTMALDRIAAMLLANLPQIEQVIAEHGNAIFSIAPDKPIRAELLPLITSDATRQSDT